MKNKKSISTNLLRLMSEMIETILIMTSMMNSKKIMIKEMNLSSQINVKLENHSKP